MTDFTAVSRPKLDVEIISQELEVEGPNIRGTAYIVNRSGAKQSVEVRAAVDWFTSAGEPRAVELGRTPLTVNLGEATAASWVVPFPDTFRMRHTRLSIEVRDPQDAQRPPLDYVRLSTELLNDHDAPPAGRGDPPATRVLSLFLFDPRGRARNVRLQSEVFGAPARVGLDVCHVTPGAASSVYALAAGHAVFGYVAHDLKARVPDKTEYEVIVRMVDADTGDVIMQEHFPYVADTDAPKLEKVDVAQRGGALEFQVTASEAGSPLQAPVVHYSTDGGATWAATTCRWSGGDLKGSTKYHARVGPFAAGATVSYCVRVLDQPENAASTPLKSVVIK